MSTELRPPSIPTNDRRILRPLQKITISLPCSKLLHVSPHVFFLVRYFGRKNNFKLFHGQQVASNQKHVYVCSGALFKWWVPSKYWATLINITHFWHTVPYGKRKGKVVPVHTRKAQAVSKGTDPRILNIDAGLRWVVSLTFRPLYPMERAPDTYKRGGWVSPKANLDVLGNRKASFPRRQSNPGSSSQ